MISNEFYKRFMSSVILLPLILIVIIEGNFFFNIFLILFLILSIIEWLKISFNRVYLFVGVIFLIFSFFSLFEIRNFYKFNDHNIFIFIYILIICISTDIGGYIFGKMFKGPKLTKISPNKTYSGSIGAFILSLLTTYFYIDNSHLFFDISIKFDFIFLLTTFFISFISQIGDILISFFKRISNVKDTGNLIPGHGGILDRIDGIIFAYPIFYILQNFINFLWKKKL